MLQKLINTIRNIIPKYSVQKVSVPDTLTEQAASKTSSKTRKQTKPIKRDPVTK